MRVGRHQLRRGLEYQSGLVLGRRSAVRFRVAFVFHQQVIERQASDQKALAVFLSDRDVAGTKPPLAVLMRNGTVQIAQNFPLPAEEPVA